ncbi:MAG: glutamine synthetase type III, partial [Bacteroidetes bacterium]|nr:glutamine synthetase type III [Bacteroidota bacterium]
HNEVAPAQHELAPIFSTANIATDHNQLVMETMKKIANRLDLVCLLHEKPFAGVNGSGKHNNWSMSTNDGQNLLEPGKTPHENEQFLLFLAAIIQAVDEYAEILRVSTANPGNDHRLGANEAPPAIISIFLGEQLTDILEQIEKGKAKSSKNGGELKLGVITLPALPKDSTDRNRTSPFAFTGNKFEFRMVGSSASIAEPNTALNTIVAETLSRIADRLEKAKDIDTEAQNIVTEIVKKHKRIIFNGNNYCEDWVKEAEKRGLPNIKSMVAAIPALISDKAIAVYEKHGVLNKAEMHSRYEIFLEAYVKTINIEALTMLDMAKRQILPASVEYAGKTASNLSSLKAVSANSVTAEKLVLELTSTIDMFGKNIETLETALARNGNSDDVLRRAEYYRDVVFKAMDALRTSGDKLETLVDAKIWPLPTYADLLFRI